jgi:hypothetical protein
MRSEDVFGRTIYYHSMRFLVVVLFRSGVIIFLLDVGFSCRPNGRIPKDEFYPFLNNEITIAWNEDSIHSCQIAFRKKHKFSYAIDDSKLEPGAGTEYYRGNFKLSGDTVFLAYDRVAGPASFEKYLVVAASGHYLIQSFTDGAKRMFLRVQNSPHR